MSHRGKTVRKLKCKRSLWPKLNLKMKAAVDTAWRWKWQSRLCRSMSKISTRTSTSNEAAQSNTLREKDRQNQMTLNISKRLSKTNKNLSIIKMKTKMARQKKWSVKMRSNTLKLRRKSKSLLRVRKMLLVRMTLNFEYNLQNCAYFSNALMITSTFPPNMLENEIQMRAD